MLDDWWDLEGKIKVETATILHLPGVLTQVSCRQGGCNGQLDLDGLHPPVF